MEAVKSLNRLSCFLHVIVETNRIYESKDRECSWGLEEGEREREKEIDTERERERNRVIVSNIFFFFIPSAPHRSLLLYPSSR